MMKRMAILLVVILMTAAACERNDIVDAVEEIRSGQKMGDISELIINEWKSSSSNDGSYIEIKNFSEYPVKLQSDNFYVHYSNGRSFNCPSYLDYNVNNPSDAISTDGGICIQPKEIFLIISNKNTVPLNIQTLRNGFSGRILIWELLKINILSQFISEFHLRAPLSFNYWVK